MHQKHKGARSELLACAWLLERGYEVFRNISPHGPIDLVAIKDGKDIFYFDVKSTPPTKHMEYYYAPLTELQQKLRVKPIFVCENGSIFIDPPPTPTKTRHCKHCNTEFIIESAKIYCSIKCRASSRKKYKSIYKSIYEQPVAFQLKKLRGAL